jgi:hypothetical protein
MKAMPSSEYEIQLPSPHEVAPPPVKLAPSAALVKLDLPQVGPPGRTRQGGPLFFYVNMCLEVGPPRPYQSSQAPPPLQVGPRACIGQVGWGQLHGEG